MTVLARVEQIWVFPVKSMAGTQVDVAEVSIGGLAGDRSWAVVDVDGKAVTAKQAPRLREVVPRLVDGELRLDVPGAPLGLDPAAAAHSLSELVGRPVHLAHSEGSGFVDVAPLHVVSTTSVADAAHAEDCDSCDIEAPRANLVLGLADGTSSEREWVGRTLAAGAAALDVVRVPKHCLGVYADVRTPGVLRRGDAVTS